MDEATEKTVEQMVEEFAEIARRGQARAHEFTMDLLGAYGDMVGEIGEVMSRAADRGEIETAREIQGAVAASLQRVTALVQRDES